MSAQPRRPTLKEALAEVERARAARGERLAAEDWTEVHLVLPPEGTEVEWMDADGGVFRGTLTDEDALETEFPSATHWRLIPEKTAQT